MISCDPPTTDGSATAQGVSDTDVIEIQMLRKQMTLSPSVESPQDQYGNTAVNGLAIGTYDNCLAA